MGIAINILDVNGKSKATKKGEHMAVLAYKAPYEDGNIIVIEVEQPGHLYEVHLDEAMRPAVLLLTETKAQFAIPFGDKRGTISPKAFSGGKHIITIRKLPDKEINLRRNLALNPYDGFFGQGVYPRASANVETRNEASFAARNAIDGIFANDDHGRFPYGSWGIGGREDAAWSLDFGRHVIIDELRLTLRADFPHDNYWEQATVEFSDGGNLKLNLVKTDQPQCFSIKPKTITGLTLKELIKSDDPSPFPALTQFEAWGCEL